MSNTTRNMSEILVPISEAIDESALPASDHKRFREALQESENLLEESINAVKSDESAYDETLEELERYQEEYMGYPDIYEIINKVQEKLEELTDTDLDLDQAEAFNEIITELDHFTGDAATDYVRLKRMRDIKEQYQPSFFANL